MKKILRNIAIASVVATGFAVTSCEDMMTVDMGDKAYQNAQDTLYSYLGIMRAMQDVAERQVILGEIRGDLVSSSDYTTDTLFAISNFDNPQDGSCSMLQVRDYYNVINNCNFYIHNADTSAMRANNPDPYMLNEYAQVKAIRAWAYLQLVKNYREVPFITEPVSNPGMINGFDYNANLVNKDNLVDILIADGLAKYVDRPFPQYGNPSDASWGEWQNGAVNISVHHCFIPIRIILGDLYLLRGASGDYETAARYYYDYLRKEKSPMSSGYVKLTFAGTKIAASATTNWGNWAGTYAYNASDEIISSIPSAANAGFGKLLTRVADIYGYTTSSGQSSDISKNDDGETNKDDNGSEIYDAKGSINVTPTYKRQYGPSNAYKDIANQQTYIVYDNNSATSDDPTPTKLYSNEDGRYYGSIYDITDDYGEAFPLCSKAAKGGTFYYTIPTYRKTLIWLRLAEAINRAGYPEFAFAILKDGLNRYTIPTVGEKKTYKITHVTGTDYDGDYYTKVDTTKTNVVVYVLVDGKTPNNTGSRFEYDENGKFVPVTTSITAGRWQWEMESYRGIVFNSNFYNPLMYVADNDKDTLRLQKFTKFLDFTDESWDATYGIHARGAGDMFPKPEQNPPVYNMTTILGDCDKGAYGYSTMLAKYGLTPSSDMNDIIDAVENIIVDELALETAFEGNRFTDLVRIAEHKNASGRDGTEWLAKKIANRGTKAAVDTTPGVDGFDGAIFTKLKDTKNWYFELPAWSVK